MHQASLQIALTQLSKDNALLEGSLYVNITTRIFGIYLKKN